MESRQIKLVIGCMLHDIGKVIYRKGDDKRNHSQSGYDYLHDEIHIEDEDILDCVKYHHGGMLSGADVKADSCAYITYIADNIASASDRRTGDEEVTGFNIHTSIQPVFNILNGNKANKYYSPGMLDTDADINYPQDEVKEYTETDYSKIVSNITDNLKGIDSSLEYINSLMEVMEANLTFVPSSTAKNEVADISLYDHVKLTAAIGSCILQYLDANVVNDYKEVLFKGAEDFYSKEAFMLASMDISGIQKFIYTISTKNALKTLRARSFYLEILMEHIVDELLTKLNLSRANLIYLGGGHCYLLLPNTDLAKKVFDDYLEEINEWFLNNFRIALYIAGGYAPCSANSLKNVPNGSYSEIYKNVSAAISKKKSHRYSAKDIIKINGLEADDYSRECKVCKSIRKVNSEGVCSFCKAIEDFSKEVLYSDFFTVIKGDTSKGLPLPGDYYLVSHKEEELKASMQDEASGYVRAYSKNKMFTGKHISTKLWVGSYTKGATFEEYAKASTGIERIAVLRADVDNLGHTFVAGFNDDTNKNKYVTLSRTATLSRSLSLFFKKHINKILEKPKYTLDGREPLPRNATIVYSGGDDIFLVGSWNEVIELAIDLKKSFEKYSEETLSISGGIGIYDSSYPISSIADEVGAMEDEAKNNPGKNSVSVFGKTFSWKEFEESVLGEKFSAIYEYFATSNEHGKAFLYNLLELIRNQDEKINFARYVYLLSRLEPNEEAKDLEKTIYKKFSSNMYKWVEKPKDRNELEVAMTIYSYMTREREE